MPLHADAPVDTVTVIGTASNLVESCVEVAVIVAVSAPELGGVKTTPAPEGTPVVALSDPAVEGLTERFTVFAKAPVPVTVGVQVVVWTSVIVVGVQTRETPVIPDAADVTAIFAEPDMFVNPAAAELAAQVAVPAPEGVNTPLDVMVPPVAVQVTAEL
jgi:hypothetical protein